MVEIMDDSVAGLSVWERDLFAHLTTHIDTERSILERYSAAADGTDSKAFRYLVKLLIEDEIRHHRLFRELASSLKTEGRVEQ